MQQSKDSHYLTRVGEEAKSLEVVRGKRVRVAEDMGGAARSWDGNADEVDAAWTPILGAALRWLGVVHRDWIAANNVGTVADPSTAGIEELCRLS